MRKCDILRVRVSLQTRFRRMSCYRAFRGLVIVAQDDQYPLDYEFLLKKVIKESFLTIFNHF